MKRKGIISIISFLCFSSLLIYSVAIKKYTLAPAKLIVHEPNLIKLTLEDKVERLKNGELALIEEQIPAVTDKKTAVPAKKAGPAKCKT